MDQQSSTPVVEEDASAYSLRAELSREMVRLYKDLFGRGPTKSRTDFAGPDIILCTLEQSLTLAERALVEMGEDQRLRDTRMYFQHATEGRFREVVERVTGRKVRAFVSGMDVGQDVAVELFYLEPTDQPFDAFTNGSTPS